MVRHRQRRDADHDRPDLDLPHRRRAPTRSSSAPATSPTAAEHQDEPPAPSSVASTGNVWTAGDNVYPDGHGIRLHQLLRDRAGAAPSSPAPARSRAITTGAPAGRTGQTWPATTRYFGARRDRRQRQELLQLRHPEQQLAHRQPRHRMRQVTGGCAAGSAQELWLQGRPAATAPRTSSPSGTSRAYSSAGHQPDRLCRRSTTTSTRPASTSCSRATTTSTSGWPRSTRPATPADPTYGIRSVHRRHGRRQPPGLRHPLAAQRGPQRHDLRHDEVHAARDVLRLEVPADRRQTFTDSGSRPSTRHRPPRTSRRSPTPTATRRALNTAKIVAAPGVLANDTDSNSDPLTAVLVTTSAMAPSPWPPTAASPTPRPTATPAPTASPTRRTTGPPTRTP